jgi:MFS family permease
VLLVRFVIEAGGPPRPPSPVAPAHPAPVANERLPLPYRRTVALLVVFSLINFPDALLLLRVSDVSNSLPFVVLAYAAYNAVYALLSYPAGALADRLGPRRVFAVGLGCFAIAYVGLGLVHTRAAIWPILLIYGGFTAATDGVGKAWIAGLVPPEMQGRGQGVYQGMTGGAVLVAGVWAGLAWGKQGTVPLLISGFAAAALIPAILRART